ncbi:MAG TPA: dihydroorotase, partial [Afifellaceae bacterium]|nr:dihydroorotase [Afifellaceae bacterium]
MPDTTTQTGNTGNGTHRPLVLENAHIVDPSRDIDAPGAVIIAEGRIAGAGPDAIDQGAPDGAEVIDCAGCAVMPGLVDMRVFVGEPGAEHRETLETASLA